MPHPLTFKGAGVALPSRGYPLSHSNDFPQNISYFFAFVLAIDITHMLFSLAVWAEIFRIASRNGTRRPCRDLEIGLARGKRAWPDGVRFAAATRA